MKHPLLSKVNAVWQTIAVLAVALLIGGVFILFSGENVLSCYGVLIDGALGSSSRISEVLVKMVPLMILALGTSIAFRAQMWNIGVEGQMLLGAVLSAAVGLYLPLPTWILMLLAPVMGMVGGGLWALIAGWLRVRFNANEVITTMMLNYVALYLLAYMVYGPMQEQGGYNYPQSASLDAALKLKPLAMGARVNTSVFVAMGVLVFMLLFWRSKFGFTVDLLGQGIKVTNYAGCKANRAMIQTMIMSGMLAGLVGWIEVFGVHFRLLEGVGAGFGNLAVVIALLGNLTPIGILLSSFMISVLLVGGATMQRMTAVPFSIIDIIQGLVIVFLITRPLLEKKMQLRKARMSYVD